MTDKTASTNANITLKAALHTIDVETKGLHALEKSLKGDLKDAFVKAVDVILAAKGRVIVTGLGKSGHIGAKIAATLASTGTPAFFVHAAEANHGDLGMISADDVLLVLSWSGETVELKGVLSHAARFSIPLIALTSGQSSTLGRQANILLLLPKEEEACPHGLAPTTSTTMQLAIGDALAVALLENKGFSASDFKVYHPGGSLGASLKYVRDIMHSGEALPIVKANTPLSQAMQVLSAKHFGCVVVVDEQNLLSGILTEGDLARNINRDLSSLSVDDVMTKNPKTVPPDMLVGAATAFINKSGISALVVCQERQILGIVHFHDLLRVGAA